MQGLLLAQPQGELPLELLA